MKASRCVTVAILLLSVLLVACQPEAVTTSEKVLRLQLPEPTSLDPPFYYTGTATTSYVIRHLFDGLTIVDVESGDALPGVAESWDVAGDGRTWTFHLKEGYLWSDGTEVTAHDFEWGWKRNGNPETGVEATWILEPIDKAIDFIYGGGGDPETLGVNAIDDYTLEVITAEPMSYLPRYVAGAMFMPLPRQAIDTHGTAWYEAENIVVNGPYTVESWEHDQELVLVKNQTYSGQPASIDRVEIKLAAGEPFLAYQEGEIDVTSVDTADLPVAQAELSDQLTQIPYKWLFFLLLDTRRPPFDDIRVRQAFYLALDRETIANDVLKASKVAAYTYIPEGTLGHNPEARIEGTVADAQQMMADAGYPGGEGFPTLKIGMVASEPGSDYYLANSAIQAMLKENLGVEVDLDMKEEAAFWNWYGTLPDTEYDMAWSNWAGDIDDPAQWYIAKSGVMATGYSNEEYDDLFSQGAFSSDPDERDGFYKRAEEIGVGGAAVIPVYYASGYWLVDPRVKGMQFEPLWGVMYWRNADISQ